MLPNVILNRLFHKCVLQFMEEDFFQASGLWSQRSYHTLFKNYKVSVSLTSTHIHLTVGKSHSYEKVKKSNDWNMSLVYNRVLHSYKYTNVKNKEVWKKNVINLLGLIQLGQVEEVAKFDVSNEDIWAAYLGLGFLNTRRRPSGIKV